MIEAWMLRKCTYIYTAHLEFSGTTSTYLTSTPGGVSLGESSESIVSSLYACRVSPGASTCVTRA